MVSLQRSGSWVFTLVVVLLTLMPEARALSQMIYPDRPGPENGGFEWKRFVGTYAISECHSRPSAIWGGGAPGTFVQIDQSVSYTGNPTAEGIELMRANHRNPIALGWSVERIGQGRRTEIDTAGNVGKVTESYATTDGVYGMMAWDRPHNVGWSTLQLRMDAQANISLTIRQRADSDASTREETCMLKKHAEDRSWLPLGAFRDCP